MAKYENKISLSLWRGEHIASTSADRIFYATYALGIIQ